MSNNAKRSRRYIRFSLRTFLFGTVLIGVGFGWYVQLLERVRYEQAIEWVKNHGGRVYYEGEVGADGSVISGGEPHGKNARVVRVEITFLENAVIDLQPLGNLKSLRWLRINGRLQVTDLSPLARLKRLEDLNTFYLKFDDLSPLAGLTELKGLTITNAPVSDLTPLAGLTKLEYLELRLFHTSVSDLTPLAALINLEKLSLYGTQVSDLTPLAGLTKLKILAVGNTPVSDVTPLANLTNLIELNFHRTQVSDLTPLAGLTNLRLVTCAKSEKFTDAEIKELKAPLPQTRFYFFQGVTY